MFVNKRKQGSAEPKTTKRKAQTIVMAGNR